jgi:Cof subfamily protein (haloacid dehalogenase superfamily)
VVARTLASVQEPRLVACDVDGTLLDPAARVSPRTAAAVRRVLAAEVPFVLVTGRPPRWIPPVVDELGHAGLAVCANGAVLYDAAADRVQEAVTLPPVQLRDLADALADAIPGCTLAVERPTRSAAPEPDDFVVEADYEHPWASAATPTAPRDELFTRAAIKMLVRHPGMTSEAMAEAATALVGDSASVTFSTSNGLIELSAAGVSKGTGLAAVARRLEVEPSDIVAFGDMPNDVPMLSWAGHGVAMANAHPTVLEIADEVTAPNAEDGVALVLERWF